MPKTVPEVDRRIARTQLALRDALLDLLPSVGWEALSIQALCERANVGRSTFYMHYQGKEALLSDSLAGLRDRLAAAHANAPKKAGLAMLSGLLAHMAEQQDVFRAVIGKRGSQVIAARFKGMVGELVDIELQRRMLPASTQPWLASYLAGGIVETLSWWVDTPQPPDLQTLETRLDALAEAAIGLAGSRLNSHTFAADSLINACEISLSKPL